MHPLLPEMEATVMFANFCKVVLTNCVSGNQLIPTYQSANTDCRPIIGASLQSVKNVDWGVESERVSV